jgi:hypothetical protein
MGGSPEWQLSFAPAPQSPPGNRRKRCPQRRAGELETGYDFQALDGPRICKSPQKRHNRTLTMRNISIFHFSDRPFH